LNKSCGLKFLTLGGLLFLLNLVQLNVMIQSQAANLQSIAPEFETYGFGVAKWTKVYSHSGSYSVVLNCSASASISRAVVKVPYGKAFGTLSPFSFYVKHEKTVPRFAIYLDKNHDGETDSVLISDYLVEGSGDWILATGGLRWGWSEGDGAPYFYYGDPWRSFTFWRDKYSNATVIYLGVVHYQGLGPIYVDDVIINGITYDLEPSDRTINDWPMFGRDPQHTGYSASTVPLRNKVLWTFQTGSNVPRTITVVDGKVYAGSMDKTIYCLNEDNGILVWSYETGGAIRSSPLIYEEKIFFGSEDGFFYSLDAKTGELVWKRYLGGGIRSSPVVYGTRVYTGSSTGFIYCLNINTGTIIWSYKTEVELYSSPALWEDRLYIGSKDYKLYCINALNGEILWTYKTDGWINSSPSIVNAKIYFGSGDNNIYCIDAYSGKFIWKYRTLGSVHSSPAIFDGRLFIGSSDNNFYCLNATNGKLIWYYTTDDEVRSSPSIGSSYVIVGSWDNYIYCFQSENGQLVWKYRTGAGVHSQAAISSGRVYIGSDDGKIYCFGEPIQPLYIIIDKYLISDYRCDVGSIQIIGFHARWDNGSDVINGTIYIDHKTHRTNTSGWALFYYNMTDIGRKSWKIIGVNCSGIIQFNQTINDPEIIWDKIKIMLSSADNRVDIGTEAKIDWTGHYLYDEKAFKGDVILNATVQRDSVGKSRFSVSSIKDYEFSLTKFSSNIIEQIWDRIKIVEGGVSKETTLVGHMEVVWFKAVYEYDGAEFTGQDGVLYVNNIPMIWSSHDRQWKYSTALDEPGTIVFEVTGVDDWKYGLSVINDAVGPLTIEWKRPFWQEPVGIISIGGLIFILASSAIFLLKKRI